MMRPVPPGEVLQEQLEELSMSASKLAAHLGVPTNRITGILNGKRALTADTAIRLSKFFGTSAEFWLRLQSTYDLRKEERKSQPKPKIIPLSDIYTTVRYRIRSGDSLRVAEPAESRYSRDAGRAGSARTATKKVAAQKAVKKAAKKAPARRTKKA